MWDRLVWVFGVISSNYLLEFDAPVDIYFQVLPLENTLLFSQFSVCLDKHKQNKNKQTSEQANKQNVNNRRQRRRRSQRRRCTQQTPEKKVSAKVFPSTNKTEQLAFSVLGFIGKHLYLCTTQTILWLAPKNCQPSPPLAGGWFYAAVKIIIFF